MIKKRIESHENALYGERGPAKTVSKPGEQRRFGIEPDEIGSFAAACGLAVSDHKCAEELEATYFKDEHGRLVGRINGTRCLVTMERR